MNQLLDEYPDVVIPESRRIINSVLWRVVTESFCMDIASSMCLGEGWSEKGNAGMAEAFCSSRVLVSAMWIALAH